MMCTIWCKFNLSCSLVTVLSVQKMLHVVTVDKYILLSANQAVHAVPIAVLFCGILDASWCKTFLFCKKIKTCVEGFVSCNWSFFKFSVVQVWELYFLTEKDLKSRMTYLLWSTWSILYTLLKDLIPTSRYWNLILLLVSSCCVS